jgi:hypothetical protein
MNLYLLSLAWDGVMGVRKALATMAALELMLF